MNYNQFAWYYDSLMEPQFYEDYFHFICENATTTTILDLGCGTGRFEKMLEKVSQHIDAIDLSSQMIEIAKTEVNASHCHFIVEDMTQFQPTETYDLILCICDSLNYVFGFENQVKVLKTAFNALKQDGTFIFDIHSPYKMNELFKNYIEEEESEDFYFYWSVKKTKEYQITHYVVIEDLNDDIRTEEKHVQESYPIEWYERALKKIGFSYVQYQDVFNDQQRIIFTVRK